MYAGSVPYDPVEPSGLFQTELEAAIALGARRAAASADLSPPAEDLIGHFHINARVVLLSVSRRHAPPPARAAICADSAQGYPDGSTAELDAHRASHVRGCCKHQSSSGGAGGHWLPSDTRSHVLALVDRAAPSWEEVPVLAGCGLAGANVEGRLDRVEPGGRTAPYGEAVARRRAGRGTAAPPAGPSLLAQSSSPALTCIMGARLAWIALMISSVLIPWRYTLVVDTYEWPSWRWITGRGTPSRASSTA